MPLVKYLTFIEKTTKQMSSQPVGVVENEMIYAEIRINHTYSTWAKADRPDMIGAKSGLIFKVSDDRLENIYPIYHGFGRRVTGSTDLSGQRQTGNKIVCSLNWINTRNKFSLHILASLLKYQNKYWFFGKETDIKPLTFESFLSLYPLQYLDQSRLSRLIQNLVVVNPQNQLIGLENLFISKKKHHAFLIKEIFNDNENALRDRDIQSLLAQKGVYLSLRTICNCRKLLNIPSYKWIDAYYGKEITFSDYNGIKKISDKIPNEAGIYELYIPKIGIDYINHRSGVIYIGSSKELRKRIASYSGNKLKNNYLKNFIDNHDVFVRFYLTENHISVEKKLLKNFKNKYGELPKANSLGG